jgi:hypothetical protein
MVSFDTVSISFLLTITAVISVLALGSDVVVKWLENLGGANVQSAIAAWM